MLLANGANIVAMQSYDNLRGYFENTLADSMTNARTSAPGFRSTTCPSRPSLREIAFLEMPGLGINRLWWTGGRYAYVVGPFRRLHRSYPVHRRPEDHHQARDRLEMVAARHESRRRRSRQDPQGQALRAASHDHRRQPRLRRPGATAASPFTTSPIQQTPSCCRTSTGRRHFPAARIRRCRCRGASSPSSPTNRMPIIAPRGCSTLGCWMCASTENPGTDRHHADARRPRRLLQARQFSAPQSA